MKLRIGLDIQHLGRTGKRAGDMGAAPDLDGDGYPDHTEALLTPRIALGALEFLHAAGQDVFLFGDGEYHERHARSDAARLHVHLALHLNAGKGDYGAFFYHPESPKHNGAELARCLSDEWARVAGEILGRPLACRAIRSSASDWTRNAHYTIKGLGRRTTPIGICCEPLFLDNPDHAPLTTGGALHMCGEALGMGILEWARKTHTQGATRGTA